MSRLISLPIPAAVLLLALGMSIAHAAAPAASRAPGHPDAVLAEVDEFDDLDELDGLQSLADRLGDSALLAAAEIDFDGLNNRYAERYADSDASGPAIDETRALSASGRVYINNVAGLVQVSTWERNEVHVGGRLGSSAETLEVTGDADELRFVVRLPKQSRSSSDTVLELRVPQRARLDVETVSADLVAIGVGGAIKVNTVSGDVAMSVASPELSVRTVSGDVRLKAPSAKAARLNSVSGDLELDGLSGQLALETVSGNVELGRGGRFSDLQLKSVSGDLELDVSLEAGARVSGQTLSGEITLIVPQALAGTALLKSFSGDTQCEGARAVEHRQGKQREFVWGDGRGAKIDLSSFSGDIRVERR
jgi:hypothetical protein